MNALPRVPLVFCCAVITLVAGPSADRVAREIYAATGVQGGLVVHLNCGDGELTAALRTGEAVVVHGVAREVDDVVTARETVRRHGLYGPVSVDRLEGERLPYIDNLVNLLVVDGGVPVPEEELMRVLAPRGVIYRRAEGGAKQTKPVPSELDEWTHYLHDPSNNAVAHDTAIGPPRHLQWEAGPRYSRHHEYTSSVAAVVSGEGRIFAIMDLGSRASIHMPARWQLKARDAFNGIGLWERPIESWFNHLWPLKNGPAQPPRRLVVGDEAVYVTLGLEAPVSRLDPATGEIVRSYAGTQFTEEILYSGGDLFLLKNDESMNPEEYYPQLMICWDEKSRTMKDSSGLLLGPDPRTVLAVNAETGTIRWQISQPVEPLTLAVDEQNVYFHNWTRIICLDRRTGVERWRSEPIVPRESMGFVYGPTLVAYQDVVLFADGRQRRKIWALSQEDGALIWNAPHYPAGHAGSPEDLLVVDGLVWCGKIAGGKDSGVFTGRDPNTGKVQREFTPNLDTYWFHHRCYRAKATDNYILASRTGIEFVDVRAQTWEAHHWVRGACTYGILPCNGLVYAPPHPCACYAESKINNFTALAPTSQRHFPETATAAEESRLQRGPAYGVPLDSRLADATDWPTYRHDAARSGATPARVPARLERQWSSQLGGRLTAPVVAQGRVFVASQETHQLYALKVEDGSVVWSVTTDGRVDSPPTLERGRVLFGSAGGWVTCLRAADGELIWRLRAAPHDARLVSYGRLESVWPVHGAVLVENDIVSCVAGRSTYLDGGLRLLRLEVDTGRLLLEQGLDDEQSPQKDVKVLNMPVAQSDILSTDGEHIFMRSQIFDRQGERLDTVDPDTDPFERATQQIGRGTHLFSPTGFLDSDAWHRSYWIFGRTYSSGCNWWFRAGRYAPAGRMLVFDDDRVFGFGREPGLFVWSHVLENHLFCSAAEADATAIERVKAWSRKSGRDAVFNREFTREAVLENRLAPKLHWSVSRPPLHARAMVLADDTLLVAGPPDILDEDEAFQQPGDPEVKAKLREQDAAYNGERGALLLGVSAVDGKTRFECRLPALPVWDGMAAVEGRVLVADAEGVMTCFGGGMTTAAAR